MCSAKTGWIFNSLFMCVCLSLCEVIASLFVRWFYVCLSVGLNSPKKINILSLFVWIVSLNMCLCTYFYSFAYLTQVYIFILIFIFFPSMVLCANTKITYSHSQSTFAFVAYSYRPFNYKNRFFILHSYYNKATANRALRSVRAWICTIEFSSNSTVFPFR